MNKKIIFKDVESQKGITLIVLIITIIVLLILAGVSIVTLIEEDGILKKTNDAKMEGVIAEKKEAVSLAYSSLKIEKLDGNDITAENLQEQLSKEGYNTIVEEIILENGEKAFKVIFNNSINNEYIVNPLTGVVEEIINISNESTGSDNENGGEDFDEPEIFNPEELTIGTAINAHQYGFKVGNYTVATSDCPSGVWRLFYQDSKYTYLINDEVSVNMYKPSDYYSSYKNGASVSIVGQKLNAIASSLFVESNTNENIRFTAWITDPEVWRKYLDKNGDAVFAIGGPTVELFVESYNATGKENKLILEMDINGYMVSCAPNWFQTTDNNGIYNKASTAHWWIASPQYYKNGNGGHALSLQGAVGIFATHDVSTVSRSVRPVVCMLTSVFNSNYADSLSN